MGTNYYLMKEPCLTCGHPKERLHIGKFSVGWCFSLHVDSYEGINDLPDWEALWDKPGNVIENEYGDRLTPADMLLVIMAGIGPAESQGLEWFRRNHAKPGPNGLARHNGPRCIGHGDGTWDLIAGAFS